MRTRITELLGIEYPIIQGGMAWVAEYHLAAAVSEAGGLGIIGAASAPPEWVRDQIQKAKKMTDKPFGVNIMLMSPYADEIAKVNVEEKVKVVTTASTTTVKTTTTAKNATGTGATVVTTTNSNNSVIGAIEVGQYASKADSRVLTAYRTLGFTAEVNPSVSYSGYYDTRNRKITLRKADDTIYHELGHFVAFISGNTDQTAQFKAIFEQEKALYTAFNKSYVTQNSAEYFAESFKEYTLNPAALKSARPKTYEAVKEAVDKFTDDRIAKVKKVYGIVWR